MPTPKNEEPDEPSPRPAGPRRGRLPLLVAAIVLVVLGVNYYLYVRSKTQYYTTRDLRLLAMLGRQVDDALKTHRQFVRNFAEDPEVFPEFVTSDLVYDELNLEQRKIADKNFRQFAWLSRREGCDAGLLPPQTGPGPGTGTVFAEQIVEVNGEAWLEFAYRGSDLAGPVTGCGKIRLASVLQAAFRATMVEPFDAVMLVDGTGTVLHHAAPQQQSVARGFGAARTAGDASYRRDVYGSTVDVRVDNLSALAEKTGWTGAPKPLEMPSLGATRNTEVSIADTTYFLFAQPSPISIPKKKVKDEQVSKGTVESPVEAAKETEKKDDRKDDKKAGQAVDPNRWSFVALVAKRRFMYEALAVAETALAAVAGLLLLIVAAWPFARLSLIGDFKPMRMADAIFLAVSTILTAAIFTIAVADAVAYRRLEGVADVHLRQFAVTLEHFSRKEILSAVKALEHIEHRWNPAEEQKNYAGMKLTPTLIPDPIGSGSTLGLRNAGGFETVAYMQSDDRRNPLNEFPFFSTFSWIDHDGIQAIKRSVKQPLPRVKLADRDYFNRVMDRRLWLVQEDGISHPFAVESLRSMTTGSPEVVVAIPTRSDRYPVLAMTLSTSQLIDPALPAGFTFAVIDERGKVLFHSDTDKNVMENFLEESDQNRQFRSVVFAHHAAHVNLRYGGQDYRAYVAPMKHVPWMMVILRHKQLLRTMNAETIVITMMCLAFLVTGAVILTFVVILLRPRYRAPWLWPNYERGHDYVRICLALSTLSGAAMVSLLLVESTALIIASFVLPPIALLTTFAALHRRSGPIFAATVTLWLILGGAWVYTLTRDAQSPLNLAQLNFYPWTHAISAVPQHAQAVAALLLTSGVLAFCRWKGGPPAVARRAHKTMAALLLVLLAIVPTMGFFKAAYRLELQNLVKYSQLTLADRLRQRATTVIDGEYQPTSLYARRWEVPAAFSTSWWLLPPKQRAPGVYDCAPPNEANSLPGFLEEFMPQYSEYSVSMRSMHHDKASDEKWWWCRDGALLTLHRTLRLAPQALTKLWPNERIAGQTFDGPLPLRNPLRGPYVHPLGPLDPDLQCASTLVFDIPGSQTSLQAAQTERADRAVEELVISSIVPSIIPSFMRKDPPLAYPTKPVAKQLWEDSKSPTELPLAGALRVVIYALAVAMCAGCLWWTLTFIAKVVFLIDIQRPRWLSRKLRPQIGDPIFLVRQTGTKIKDLCEDGFHRIRYAYATTDGNHRKQLAEIDRLPAESRILIEEFEQGVEISAFAHKLQLIEHVLSLRPRSMVIISTLTPLEIMALAEAAGADRERWKKALQQFIWITEDQLKPVSSSAPADSGDRLVRETANDAVLEKIAGELNGHDLSQGQLIDEFRERAASYYDMLWSSCTDDEKLILSQLAHEGLLNPKKRHAIRRLMGRGLIQRKPQLSLMNESFRKHVLAASAAEGVDAKYVHEHDPWTNISRPLALVLVALIVMFLVTQKDLANTATAVVTALAGGIPALIRLMGVLTDRKQPAA